MIRRSYGARLTLILDHRWILPREHGQGFLIEAEPHILRGNVQHAARLRQSEDWRAPSLMFLILNASRPEEVRGMPWSEAVDFETSRLWAIPGPRTKKGREHRVPLSNPAMEILKWQITYAGPNVSDFVFPGQRAKIQEEKAMRRLMQDMGIHDITPHRFRSSFRDWAGDMTDFSDEVIEACLAHHKKSKTEKTYRRLDAFEKRKKLMAMWAAYCCSRCG